MYVSSRRNRRIAVLTSLFILGSLLLGYIQAVQKNANIVNLQVGARIFTITLNP